MSRRRLVASCVQIRLRPAATREILGPKNKMREGDMRVTLMAAAMALVCATRTGHAEAFKSEADLVAAVRPAFVDIYNRAIAPAETEDGGPSAKSTVLIQDEVGAGFIVDPSGIIVTNRHVVDHAYSLFVTLENGEHVPARLIGKALTFDIALIKIDVGRPLPSRKWATAPICASATASWRSAIRSASLAPRRRASSAPSIARSGFPPMTI